MVGRWVWCRDLWRVAGCAGGGGRLPGARRDGVGMVVVAGVVSGYWTSSG